MFLISKFTVAIEKKTEMKNVLFVLIKKKYSNGFHTTKPQSKFVIYIWLRSMQIEKQDVANKTKYEFYC